MIAVLPRAGLAPGAWDAFVATHDDGWFFHRETWLAYCLAYAPEAVDRSFAVVDGGTVLAVCPCVVEGGVAQMGGEPGLAPLVRVGLGTAPREAVVDRIHAHLRARVKAVRFRGHPGAAVGEVVAGHGFGTYSWTSSVVDLRRPEPKLWGAVRKSYRGLIRTTDRDRVIMVSDSGAWMQACQDLHLQAAGRQTRSAATWQMMADWAKAGDAIVAMVGEDPDGGGRWIGYAYAIRWKRWAYYASGATIVPDVAHALQWALIKALRADERHHYEVGWGLRPADHDQRKAAGIAEFKRGFGGDDWVVEAAERGLKGE